MNSLQRTNEWQLARKGHITASQIAVLLNNRKVAMSDEEIAAARAENPKSRITTKEVPFSQSSFTYLDNKIAELFMTDDAYLEYLEQFNFENSAMRWGTFWEDRAREEYSLEMGYQVIDSPFIPMKGFEQFAGGSPDGEIPYENGIVEFKCPANPAVHLKHFMLETPEDLKELNIDYYSQCQFNMVCVGLRNGRMVDWCDFVSYDPRTSASKQMKILRLPQDAMMQAEMIARVGLAREYYREQIDKIENINAKILSYE